MFALARAGGRGVIHGAGFRRAHGERRHGFADQVQAVFIVILGLVGDHQQAAAQAHEREHHAHPGGFAARAHVIGIHREEHALGEEPARGFAQLHAVSAPGGVGVRGHAHGVAYADGLREHAPAGKVVSVRPDARARGFQIGAEALARVFRL